MTQRQLEIMETILWISTQELRDGFLIRDLYQPDQVEAVYSHVDRVPLARTRPQNKQGGKHHESVQPGR